MAFSMFPWNQEKLTMTKHEDDFEADIFLLGHVEQSAQFNDMSHFLHQNSILRLQLITCDVLLKVVGHVSVEAIHVVL